VYFCGMIFLLFVIFLTENPRYLLYVLLVAQGLEISKDHKNPLFDPFYFLRTSVHPPWKYHFYIIHFFWSLLFVISKIYVSGVKTVGDLFTLIKSKKAMDLEILLLFTALGIGAVTFINVGYNIRWFSILASSFALPFFLAILPQVKDQFIKDAKFSQGWRKVTVPAIIGFLLLAYVGGYACVKFNNQVKYFYGNILSFRKNYVQGNSVIGTLIKIGEMKKINKKDYIIYIPPSNLCFWALPFGDRIHPFLVPSLTGMPLLAGFIQKEDSDPATYYGYDDYDLEEINQFHETATPEQLCLRALSKNFSQIIILRCNNNKMVEERLQC